MMNPQNRPSGSTYPPVHGGSPAFPDGRCASGYRASVSCITYRHGAGSYFQSQTPCLERGTGHDWDLGLDPDLLGTVRARWVACTRGQQIRHASAGSDVSSAMTAAATAQRPPSMPG